jgi:hypothetical protein
MAKHVGGGLPASIVCSVAGATGAPTPPTAPFHITGATPARQGDFRSTGADLGFVDVDPIRCRIASTK